jgi:imidazolonepropionase-like amidohydrolase
MPGLTDAHEHPTATELNPEKARTESLLYKVLGMKDNLERILQAGFTTVRDTGGAHWSVKQAVEDCLIKGPRLLIACGILSTTGGHGDPNLRGEQVFHTDTDRLFKGSRTCDGVDECRKAAREQFRSGADFIKLCATGGCASPNDEPWHLQFSEPELRAIVEEARAVGLYVAAHCEEDNGARRAVEFGVRTIEHGFFLSEDTAKVMKEKGAYLVTTLAITWWLLTYGKEYGASEWLLRKVKEPRGPGQPDSLEAMVIGMRNALKAGVPVGSGADYISSKMFGTEAMELKLKVEYGGMTPYEAIKSATIVNAEVMRLKDKIGSIEPGKWADIIAVEGMPDKNINILTEPANIKLVMKKGEMLKNIG